MFRLSPLGSASVIFANAFLGKAYMTFIYRATNPDGLPGNKIFENAHKSQLNEAEWSPYLIAGLLCLHVQCGNDPTVAASLAAFGSVWYLWMRLILVKKGADLIVLPGGFSRYIAAGMITFKLMWTG